MSRNEMHHQLRLHTTSSVFHDLFHLDQFLIFFSSSSLGEILDLTKRRSPIFLPLYQERHRDDILSTPQITAAFGGHAPYVSKTTTANDC